MDMENLFGTQDYYAGQGSRGTQDYYTGQDYSIGHGSGQGSGMGGPPNPVEDESPVEEVAPIKSKNVLKRCQKAKTTINKEASNPRITTKEVTLCKAWIDVSKDSIRGNTMKTRREEVREVRPSGWDRAKNKVASSSSCSEFSSIAGGGLVELVANKWKSIKSATWGKKKEQQESYIHLKNQELEINSVAKKVLQGRLITA
ncbi:hypothetical protein Tco_1390237 [Tanacetum coccineum]